MTLVKMWIKISSHSYLMAVSVIITITTLISIVIAIKTVTIYNQ